MIKIIVLLGIVFVILHFTGLLETEGKSFADAVIFSTKGKVLIAALVILALLYPSMSFTALDLRGDIDDDRQAIIDTFADYGYSLSRQADDRLVFRSNSIWKRLTNQFDDVITVTAAGRYMTVEGLKKDVVRIELRLNSRLNPDKQE